MAASTENTLLESQNSLGQQFEGRFINLIPSLQHQNLDRVDDKVEESALFGGSIISSFEKGRIPCLSGRGGSMVSVLQTGEVLQIGMHLLKEGECVSTPLCACVYSFLQDIHDLGTVYPGTENWHQSV
jgi:hypothetical protein